MAGLRKEVRTHASLGELLGSQLVGIMATYALAGVPIEGIREVAEHVVRDPETWSDLAKSAEES